MAKKGEQTEKSKRGKLLLTTFTRGVTSNAQVN